MSTFGLGGEGGGVGSDLIARENYTMPYSASVVSLNAFESY